MVCSSSILYWEACFSSSGEAVQAEVYVWRQWSSWPWERCVVRVLGLLFCLGFLKKIYSDSPSGPQSHMWWKKVQWILRTKNLMELSPRGSRASNKYFHMTSCACARRSCFCAPSDVQELLRCHWTVRIAVRVRSGFGQQGSPLFLWNFLGSFFARGCTQWGQTTGS